MADAADDRDMEKSVRPVGPQAIPPRSGEAMRRLADLTYPLKPDGESRCLSEFDRHCSGPNLDATLNDIIRRIERYSRVKLAEAFAIPDLDREVKWHCRYARQNGIHVSPTFMVDGLVQLDMSSGDPAADWVARLSDPARRPRSSPNALLAGYVTAALRTAWW
jgi:hypothetical protein